MLLACIALYLLLNLAVGLWASRRVHTTEDFVLAGRRLSFGLATMVTFATWFGSETMMGAPAQFVEGGLLAVIEEPFGAALCLILVGIFYAKLFYRLKIITFCDFFRNRFGQSAEVLSAVLIVPSYFGWIAAQFVAMGVVGEVIFGVSLQTGILVGAGLVTLYTLTGGMWSVSITDFLHNLVLITGLGILTYLLLDQSGGLKSVLAAQPPDFFRFVPKTLSWQSSAEYVVAWITIGLGSIPQQDIFQRVMAAKNERIAVRSSVTAGFLYLTVALLPLFIALMALRLYPELRQGDLKLIIPTMVLRHAPMVVQVLFFGALVSALLSTASGAILAPAAVTGENLVKQFYPRLSDGQSLAVIRISVLGVSAASVWMALARQDIFELVSESSALSLVSLFVPMTAGLYWKRANLTGCLLSMGLGWGVWFLCLHLETALPPVLGGFVASVLGLVVGTYLTKK